MNKFTILTLGAALTLAAGVAAAANGSVSGTVSRVAVTENSSNGDGDSRQIEIQFNSSVTFCGSTGQVVVVKSTSAGSELLFDAWVRTAEAALLSGRTLRVGWSTNNASAVCHPWYLQLQ